MEKFPEEKFIPEGESAHRLQGPQDALQGPPGPRVDIPTAEPRGTHHGAPVAPDDLLAREPLCGRCGGPVRRAAPAAGCTNPMHPPDHPTLAERLAREIMQDVSRREALGAGWASMTDPERGEALECWVEIVRVCLNS